MAADLSHLLSVGKIKHKYEKTVKDTCQHVFCDGRYSVQCKTLIRNIIRPLLIEDTFVHYLNGDRNSRLNLPLFRLSFYLEPGFRVADNIGSVKAPWS